jgi:F-type H+-transporting ATPase subunit delta
MTDMKEYARALFLLTEEMGITDTALCDVRVCNEALISNPDYVKLTDTPALATEEKIALIDKAFLGICEPVGNLIKILCEKHSVYAFSSIAKEYERLYNESRGICPAEVISAVPLADKDLEKIKAKLEAVTGKKIIIKNTTDTSIIGGLKLRYGGLQLDGSLKTRLESIEKSLKDTII